MFFFLILIIFFNEVISILNSIRNYIKDDKYKVNIVENKVHVMNYKKIIIFDDENIVIDLEDRILTIKGDNLIINKMMSDELLITGNIKNIEIR